MKIKYLWALDCSILLLPWNYCVFLSLPAILCSYGQSQGRNGNRSMGQCAILSDPFPCLSHGLSNHFDSGSELSEEPRKSRVFLKFCVHSKRSENVQTSKVKLGLYCVCHFSQLKATGSWKSNNFIGILLVSQDPTLSPGLHVYIFCFQIGLRVSLLPSPYFQTHWSPAQQYFTKPFKISAELSVSIVPDSQIVG